MAGRLENLPGWRRLGERRAFPEDAERLAVAPRVAAPVPGALARSRKKRAVFAFVNKREPELFPTGEAGRAAPAFCWKASLPVTETLLYGSSGLETPKSVV